MPLYEYQCPKCKTEVEALQKRSDPPPQCCNNPMKKQISRSSFALKGSGWYKDHYGLKETK